MSRRTKLSKAGLTLAMYFVSAGHLTGSMAMFTHEKDVDTFTFLEQTLMLLGVINVRAYITMHHSLSSCLFLTQLNLRNPFLNRLVRDLRRRGPMALLAFVGKEVLGSMDTHPVIHSYDRFVDFLFQTNDETMKPIFGSRSYNLCSIRCPHTCVLYY